MKVKTARRQVVGFFDKKRGAPCVDVTPVVTPYYKCLPAFQIWDGHYGDASCETRVSEVRDAFPSCETETPIASMDAHYDEMTCPTALAYDLYEISGRRSTSTYEDDGSRMCIESGDSEIDVYVQGPPIRPTSSPCWNESFGIDAVRTATLARESSS